MKKSNRKLLGLLLTASLAATTVFPMQGIAAEQIDREIEHVTQTGEETAAPEENKMPSDNTTDIQTPSGAAADTGIQQQIPGNDGQSSDSTDTVPKQNQTADTTNPSSGEENTTQREQAPETGKSSKNDSTEAQDSLQTPKNVAPARAASSGISPQAASYDINQPVIESFRILENGETLSVDDTVHFEMSAYDTESGIKSVIVSLSGYNYYEIPLSYSGGNIYTGSVSCKSLTSYGGNFYVNRIRVEDYAGNYIDGDLYDDNGRYLHTFDVVQEAKVTISNFQMQTFPLGEDGKLRPGSTVQFTASVECIGGTLSNSGSMRVETCDKDPWRSEYKSITYDPATKTVRGIFTVGQTTYPTDWRLCEMEVSTVNGKYFRFQPENIEPDANLTFTVTNENYDLDKPVIESITIDKNGQTVKAGDQISIKVKVSEANPTDWMNIHFSPEASGISNLSKSLFLNKSTMEYTGTINITDNTYPTKWDLTYLSVYDKNGNTATLSSFREDWDTARPWHFTVDPKGYLEDNENPVIESITIDKNGQWVQPGDTVTLTVKVDEANPSPRASATFYPQVSYVIGAFDINLYYQEDIQSYVGTIPITNDTYPCEWTLTYLSVTDVKGHYAGLSSFMSNWSETYPWYYRVKSGNTFREDVKDVTFSFYGFAPMDDGSFQSSALISTQTVKNVGRRTSLKELGVSLPQPSEDVTAKWQYGWGGPEIDENSPLLFFNREHTYYDLWATYEQGCANVYLTYMTKDKGIQTVVIPQFVSKETTYREVLNALPLPEDAEETGFSGYKLTYDYGETVSVGDCAYIYAEAEYNNSQVAWHTRYLDENGREVNKVIPRAYEKGTAVTDALATLEAPEGIGSLEFDRWVLTGADGGDTLSDTMESRYVTAVYRGKTTLDVSYTYRGEDGALACGSKLMLMNGENLSDAAVQGEATSAFKEVNHFNGLMLFEWTGSTDTDLGNYKKINFQAIYYNCVVILKFPDDTCMYIVVNKNSSFTLPTETEAYTDISWEGYAAGETVTITEDREFLAASAVPRDGISEKPSGVTLSQEEIEKLITDIENTAAGSTIHVDMKKATVVPKEVLEAIQGKEVNIVLDMGTYSWSIGGTEVAATDLKDIDLEITLNTDAIPSSLVDSVAEGKPSTQISLTHNGEFGFRADLTLNLGSEHSGETGNLYYYDSSGKLVFRNAGEIGADGSISLSFSHASDYVVVIDSAASKDENEAPAEEPDDKPETNNGNHPETPAAAKNTAPVPDVKQEPVPNVPKSPKTGE